LFYPAAYVEGLIIHAYPYPFLPHPWWWELPQVLLLEGPEYRATFPRYRKLLRGAVAYDGASLVGIFRYTATRQLMGAGAEDNCSILHALLEHWGDSRFAAVLRGQPLRVREAVIAMLDYGWRYPGWTPREFPITYQLAKHQKIVTSPP
jgi:hypothetical protein